MHLNKRKTLQYVSLIFLAFIPCKLIYFDIYDLEIFFFGLRISKEYMIILILLFLFVVLLILYIVKREGKVICSWLCPTHFFLELVSRRKKHKKLVSFSSSFFFSFMGAEVLVAFFIPIDTQISMITQGDTFFHPLVIVLFSLFGLFSIVFYIMKEKFCKKGCPYSLVQLVLQDDETRSMQFVDPDNNCIKCGRCDDACPMKLVPRKECHEVACSNCRLCEQICRKVLPNCKPLFTLTTPE